MIQHYLKLAVRNLLKYKAQTGITLVGLAVGFAFFTLSAVWVRYEMTYDSFHPDAERVYLVRTDASNGGYDNRMPYRAGSYLKTNYQEVEDFCLFEPSSFYVQKGKTLQEYRCIAPDSTWMRMMNVRIVEGTDNFYRLTSQQTNEVAVMEKMALELFGTTRVIGETLMDVGRQKEYRIGAVVTDWGTHTNFPYSILGKVTGNDSWDDAWYYLLVKLAPGTDAARLLERMNRSFPPQLQKDRYDVTGRSRFCLEPLAGLRYASQFVPEGERGLQFRYIIYFSVTGILIIFCAFVNYMTVYAERFRIRQREMALRKVCGASERSLLGLLGMELLLMLLMASFLGMVLVEVSMEGFCRYARIDAGERTTLYLTCLIYLAGMMLLALLLALASVALFRKRSLQRSISRAGGSRYTLAGRRGSLVLQLTVCLAFLFCTFVMQKQLHHLRHAEVGMEYSHRASLAIWMGVDMEVWAEKIKALPMVTEVVKPVYWPIVSMGAPTISQVDQWDGMEIPQAQPVEMREILAGEEFFAFYEMQLLAGEWVSERSGMRDVNIMEHTARMMGWTPEEAIGKHIYYSNKEVEPMTVVGVMKDCAYTSPTSDLPHTAFVHTRHYKWMWPRCFVLFKYRPGTWEECRRCIEEMQQEECPDRKLFLHSEEEVYNGFLKSEDTLSRLLGFSSLVCILICMFGIYSLVTLTCEQRRKEIAIRKVHGASMGHIVALFFKEYLRLLLFASLLAFSGGAVVMRHWIEGYNRQTSIGATPFVLIFVGAAMMILLCIGHRVWQAARQNPAEVVKSE